MRLELLENAIWKYIFEKNFERFSSHRRKEWSYERKKEYEECVELGKFILDIKNEASRGCTFIAVAIETNGEKEDPNAWVGSLQDDPYIDLGVKYDHEKGFK